MKSRIISDIIRELLKITLSQAIELKNMSRENNLTAESITGVLESLNS
jgi:hypothetical protein